MGTGTDVLVRPQHEAVETRQCFGEQSAQLSDDLVDVHVLDVLALLAAATGGERVDLVQPVHAAEIVAVCFVEAVCGVGGVGRVGGVGVVVVGGEVVVVVVMEAVVAGRILGVAVFAWIT